MLIIISELRSVVSYLFLLVLNELLKRNSDPEGQLTG